MNINEIYAQKTIHSNKLARALIQISIQSQTKIKKKFIYYNQHHLRFVQ